MIFHSYDDASAKPGTHFIVFSGAKHTFTRFDAPTFRDCLRAYLEYANGTAPEERTFMEIIDCCTWHRLAFDVDYNIPPGREFADAREWFHAFEKKFVGIACDCYFSMFGDTLNSSDITFYDSIDAREPTRLSAHIIIRRMVPHCKIAAQFANLVISALPHDMKELIDRSFYSRRRNLRLLGCVKFGSVRAKRHGEEELSVDALYNSLVCAEAPHAPEFESEIEEQIASTAITEQQLTEIIQFANETYGDAHTYLHAIGSLVLFRRQRASMCRICERVHEHENSLMLRARKQGGDWHIIEYCRRDPEKSRVAGIISCALDVGKTIARVQQIENRELSQFAFSRVETYCESAMRALPHDFATLFIRAPMKLGKTKALKQFISDARDARIIFISFRRTFSAATAKMFPNFELYYNLDGDIEADRVIIQVESLHRIVPDKYGRADIVILDESESIIEQFGSGLSSDASGDFAVFQWLLRGARQCIAMDAFLSERTASVISRIRGTTGSVLIQNTFKNAVRDCALITSSKEMWLLALRTSIEDGKRIVICTNTVAQGRVINEYAREICADDNIEIKFYCAETSCGEKNRDFSDVHAAWSTCRILIYTPTLTAGVSFESEHFDCMFGYFVEQSCSAQTCIQMMGRIRRIRDHRAFIYINSTGGKYPETRGDLQDYLRIKKSALSRELPYNYDDEGMPRIADSDYAEICIQNIIAANKSRNSFGERLIQFISEPGTKCIPLSPQAFRDLFGYYPTNEMLGEMNATNTSIRKQIKLERAREIAGARELSHEEYVVICSRGANRRDDNFARLKYEIRDVYDRGGCDLSADFVYIFGEADVMEKYRNLRELSAAYARQSRDMLRALNELREIELASVVRAGSEELRIKSTFETHRLAYLAARQIGFDGVFDSARIPSGPASQAYSRNTPLISQMEKHFGTDCKSPDEFIGFKEFASAVFMQTYGITIVAFGDILGLEHHKIFRTRPDGLIIPVENIE